MGLLGGPCTLPEGLQPGVRIPIKANECAAVLAEKASLVRPDQRQVDWQRYEQTAFLHFGVNTFTGQEWGQVTRIRTCSSRRSGHRPMGAFAESRRLQNGDTDR